MPMLYFHQLRPEILRVGQVSSSNGRSWSLGVLAVARRTPNIPVVIVRGKFEGLLQHDNGATGIFPKS